MISRPKAGEMKIIEIHTHEEIEAEVEVLRADVIEVLNLAGLGVLRAHCFEEDLRTEAYNRLTDKKFGVREVTSLEQAKKEFGQ